MRPRMRATSKVIQLGLLIGIWIELPVLPTTAQTAPPKEAQPPAPGSQKRTGDDRSSFAFTSDFFSTAAGSQKLTGHDARRVEELDTAIEAALKADRWDDAVAKALELFALRTRAQGPKHFETVSAEWRLKTLRRVAPMSKEDQLAYQSAKTMNAEGEALTGKGKHAQALPLHEKVLEIRRRVLGDEFPETSESYNNLGYILFLQGKYVQSLPLYEKALAIRRRLLTDDHTDTAESYNNVAAILNADGKYAQAQPLFEKQLGIYRRLLTDGHPGTAVSYSNTANNLNSLGKS